jgi:hypothetical protein
MSENHFNQLTPGEDERLALFIEECGEAIHAAAKILRHGFGSVDPTLPPEERTTNRSALAKEMGDIRASMEILFRTDIDRSLVEWAMDDKLSTVSKWLHHQRTIRP